MRSSRAPVALIALASVLGCGDNDDLGPVDAGDGVDGSAVHDAGPPDAGLPVPAVPACAPSCASADDCGSGRGGIVDDDNYVCVDNTCIWLGCRSDGECVESYGDPDYRCEVAFEATSPNCWPTCATAADCAKGALADNYECDQGLCHYIGCLSDQECVEDFDAPKVCRPVDGSVPACVAGCSTAADCDLDYATADADNFSCIAGGCVYLGCNSDTECQQVDDGTVCYGE